MPLRLRRGTDSTRTSITPVQGEPIYTTDTKKLYIGDGITAGGIEIGETAATASYVLNAVSASYATTALTASYALSYSGTSGTSGANGTSGTSGVSGTSGTAGTAGSSGTSGTSGANGTSGTAGTSGTGFTTVATPGDNRILTSDGTVNAAVGESNLTFDGSTLTVTGDAVITGKLTAQEFNTELISSSIIFESGSTIFGNSLDDTHRFTGSLLITGSNTVTGDNTVTGQSFVIGGQTITGSLITTGSNLFIGTQIVRGDTSLTGSLLTSGSNIFIGTQSVTGSLFTSGSNFLVGNTSLTGSFAISGSQAVNGYIGFEPVGALGIPTDKSASYIYTSGSTNDLYFTQYNGPFTNTTRLRWLEGNMYTGLLYGGRITSASSTTFNVSSGSGIVVTMNATVSTEPYPTIQYVNWPTYTNQPVTYLTTSIQTYVGINSSGGIIQQNYPWNDGQYNESISLGTVIHQNTSSINATISYPNVAYGYKQRTYDFVKAFGPLKLSGYTIVPSSSLGLTVGSGTAFADGRNYQNDPNNPSYITDPGTAVSKIFRYYQSGSQFIQDTNGGAGYTVLDPARYNNNGTLTNISPSTPISIQRIFWYPNSATKGIVAYYGNAQYSSITDAVANLPFETFNEVENTKQNAIYLGAIALRYNADFNTSGSYQILPGGIFRSVGGQGGGGGIPTARLTDLSDVEVVAVSTGDLLTYNGSIWTHNQILSGDYSLTGSLYGTSSYATNALTASYALSYSGTSGTSGANGTSGTSGANGSSGSSGSSGTSGANGADGTSGSSGTSGANGSSGSSGTSGANGADGTSGSSGTSGANGTSGTSGVNGNDGTSGSSGTSGANGTSGTSGANGTSGTSGSGFNTINNASGSRLLVSDGTTNAATASATMTISSTNVTVSGSMFLSGSLSTPVFIDYEERFSSPTISAGLLTLNLSNGNVFNVTIDGGIATLNITNPPAANNAGSFVLVTTGNGTAYPIVWGTAVTWSGGTAPTVTSTNGKKDFYGFISLNQGTNWYGFIGAQNF
jgi:hypothetical protein